MFISRKPHPDVNEYHTSTNGLCGILFGMDIVEGEDKPKGRRKDKYHEYGNTGCLLLRLCILLFMTGKVVILERGFCVLPSVISLKKMGVLSAVLIRKRRYWKQYVKEEEIKLHF